MGLQIISILLFLLTVIYVALVCYMRLGWRRLPLFSRLGTSPTTPVSILIAARNEERNIGRTIDCILEQDYPKDLFELIVIDDHSTDNTASIIISYAERGVRLLKLNATEPLNSYKKKAIAEGISLAGGELIITTDADCRMGEKWLSTIISYYEREQPFLISSPVIYHEEQHMFECMQTLEFLYLIGLGAAGIGNKHPSTCNGANLAYRKDTFYEMDGFKGIDDLASGDDELFLHKVAAKYPERIGFCKSEHAIVYTDAKPTLKEFIQQRKRWASKSTRYKDKAIVALGVIIWTFNLLLMLVGLASFAYPAFSATFIACILMKWIVELYFLYPIAAFAKRKKLLYYGPLLTLIHIVYMVYIGIAGNVGKYHWKGRNVR